MSKTMCKSDVAEKGEAKFICKKCSAKAKKEKHLCKPKKI
jgi:hypothetical protein